MSTPHLNIRAVVIVLNATFNVLVALWIFSDARRRQAEKPLFAALATLLLGPLWLAFYLTDRPLCADERREGGFGWNWMRNFAWAWTGATAQWLAIAAVYPRAVDGAPSSLLDNAGPLLIFWLVPIGLALGVGYAVRRPDTVQPGGPAPARARVPLAAVFVVVLLITWLALGALHNWIVPQPKASVDGAGGGSRTRTAVGPVNFKSTASAIPPPRR
jgi:hypothetical protein